MVVTCQRDDTATLVTLTARELNAGATIVAAVRESENAHLLSQSGATTVIVSAEAAGRLLGLATSRPRSVEVLEDLLVAGRGLELTERDVTTAELGGPPRLQDGCLPIALVRDGTRFGFDDQAFLQTLPGDVVVSISSERERGRGFGVRVDHS
ncbi:MAG: NAD-binding protein [Acidimicrobiia bacterium]